MLKTGLLVAVALTTVAVAAVVLRNYQMDQGTAALKEGNYRLAFEKLKPLAAIGDNDAQYLLGYVYAFGWGVEKNDEESLKWFRRSAGLGESESDKAATAAFYVARDFAGGSGVPKSNAEAVRWLKIAAELGSRDAAQRLAQAYTQGQLGLPQDSKQAEFWRNRLSNHGLGSLPRRPMVLLPSQLHP